MDAATGTRFVSGGVVRLLRCYPGPFEAYACAPNGSSQLLERADAEPGYKVRGRGGHTKRGVDRRSRVTRPAGALGDVGSDSRPNAQLTVEGLFQLGPPPARPALALQQGSQAQAMVALKTLPCDEPVSLCLVYRSWIL